jgi:outer membrane protein OmpA-like peptidoglycan-associated protein
MKLSWQRANRVKEYFVSKGIETNRMDTQGYGPNKPLNKGRTSAEKALNRRVELKLSN